MKVVAKDTFFDLVENKLRIMGDIFECSPERFEKLGAHAEKQALEKKVEEKTKWGAEKVTPEEDGEK